MRRVRREDRWLDRQMGIPEDLPAKEREAIREQARYETFRQGSAMVWLLLFEALLLGAFVLFVTGTAVAIG